MFIQYKSPTEILSVRNSHEAWLAYNKFHFSK